MYDTPSVSGSAAPLLSEAVSTGEAIVRVLEQAGIDMVFGMPGGFTEPIFDALYDHRSTIRTVLVREEARAGVMAETYGRLTGRPGVAIGQAAFMVNANFGAIEAHLSSTPMLLLTDLSDNAPYSLHAPYQSGTGEYGAWDAPRAFESFTKLSLVATHASQAVQATQLAIKHALSGEPGPTAVLFHSHAWRDQVDPESAPALYHTGPMLAVPAPRPDPAALERAADLLAVAERPVVISGNGVRMSRAYAPLVDLAERLGATVASSAAGKSTFPETHELALGVYGNFGTAVANAVVGDADVVLVVGSKLGATDTAFENARLLDPTRQKIVQIDIEPKHASWTFPAEVALIGDAGQVLGELAAALDGRIDSDVVSQRKALVQAARQRHGFFNALELTSDATPVLPQRVIHELQSLLPDDAIVTGDAGENRLFMTHYFQTKAPGMFLQPAGVGAMGYAIPSALAAKLIHPERPVVAVCGDGGFAIGMNGLMTAIEEDVPIVVVVFNNNALGWVKHGQGERIIAADFATFDHGAIARAMGCDGVRVETADGVAPAIREALASGRPSVVDVHTSIDESYLKVTSPLVVMGG